MPDTLHVIDAILSALAGVSTLIARLGPAVHAPTILAAAAASLAIRFGPTRIRPWCAAPFVLMLLIFTWAGLRGQPEYFVLCSLCACPLAMWWARSFTQDPMRRALLGED